MVGARGSITGAFGVEAELFTYFAQHSLFQESPDVGDLVGNLVGRLSADRYFITDLPTPMQPYASSFLSVFASLQSITADASDSSVLHEIAATAIKTAEPTSESANVAPVNLPMGGGTSVGAVLGLIAWIAGFL